MKAYQHLTTILLTLITITAFAAKEVEVIVKDDRMYKKAQVIKKEESCCDKEPRSWWSAIDPVISIRGGVDYAKVGGKSESVTISPNIAASPNEYVPTDKWHSAGVWSGLLGIEFPVINDDLRWQSGVSYYETGKFLVDGFVREEGAPETTDLAYKYEVKNQRVLWENKLLAEFDEIYLYFLVGLGASFNKASDYHENNDPNPFAYPNAPFEDKTTSSFTYTFGVGIEIPIWEDMRIGVGYQYSELGKVQLDEIEDQPTGDTLKIDSTPTHEVLANITYLF